jgi:hypothetical protein
MGEFEGHSKRVLSCSFKPTRPFRVVSCGEDFGANYYEGPPFKFKTSHRWAAGGMLTVSHMVGGLHGLGRAIFPLAKCD